MNAKYFFHQILLLKYEVCQNSLKLLRLFRSIKKKMKCWNFLKLSPCICITLFFKNIKRLIFNRCMDYIRKNNLLNEMQFGFRPNHSAYVAIIRLVDKIVNAVERSETTVVIFLDLSKALIWHDISWYFVAQARILWFQRRCARLG